MASTTRKKAATLTVVPTSFPSLVKGAPPEIYEVVPDFAIFIDTHRDQPHVPTFEDDLHRGWCRPTPVHYIPPPLTGMLAVVDDGQLIREDGRVIDVDPKHRFLETDWWREFVTDFAINNGSSPLMKGGDQDGQMPTKLLRDARNKVYKLKSLRQIVRSREAASVSASGTPFTVSRRKRKAST